MTSSLLDPVRVSSSVLSILGALALVACSTTVTEGSLDIDGTEPASGDQADDDDAEQPASPKKKASKDAGAEESETPVDKTPRFALELDGELMEASEIKVKVEGNQVKIEAVYEPELPPPYGSASTFTLTLPMATTGTGPCTTGRSAFYWFKDGGGTLRGIGTEYSGGGCTMTLTSKAADGFSSGSASGTLGGAMTKSFSIEWAQPIAQ
jgi:hypothetical protein